MHPPCTHHAVVGFAIAEAEPDGGVGMHRRKRLGEVQLAGLDFGEVYEEVGEDLSPAPDEVVDPCEELIIGEGGEVVARCHWRTSVRA